MKKKLFRVCSRTVLVALEVFAVFAGLLFLVVGVLAWRLMAGPVDVGFARNYIEQALHDPVSGHSVSLNGVVVQWPDLRSPVILRLEGVNLRKDDVTVVGIKNVTLGLATRYLLIGDIEPVSIAIDSPTLNLIRTENNQIRLSLEDDKPAQPENENEPDPLMRIIDTLSKPAGEIDSASPLDHLKSVEISRAKMVVADYMLGITWFISPLDMTFARDPKGLIITASAELPGGRDRASRVQGDLVYLRNEQDFIANIHLQDFDPHILSRKIEELAWLNDHYTILNGNVEIGFNSDFHIHRAAVSLSSANGALLLEGAYDRPFAFEQMFVEAFYDEKLGIADLRDFSVTANGVTVSTATTVKIAENSINAPVTIRIPDLPQEKISSLWPDSLRGEGAEIWLTQKLSKGRIQNAVATFEVQADKVDKKWMIDIRNIVADFAIENMDIDYRAPLWPVRQASGTGHFDDDVLTINIAQGKIGDMTVRKGTAAIDKIIEGKGHAKIDIDLAGPLQNVLRYIGPEPIGMTQEKLGLKVADVKGQADLAISVSFPTIRDLLAEQVIVRAKGTLTDVLLPDIVKTLDLSGGPFTLMVAEGAATLAGKGRLDGRDIEFDWKEFVDPEGKPFASRVRAKLVADKGLRDTMGIGLDDWIAGAFPIDVTYTEYGGGKAEAEVKADLATGSLMIAPLEHVKPPGHPGTATCKITFSGGDVQEVRNLNVDAAPLRMAGARFVFDTVKGNAELRRGEIPTFILKENQFGIDMEFAKSGMLKMSVSGAFLDARPFLGDGKKKDAAYDGPPVKASIAVSRMRTHPARMVDKAKIYVDMNKAGEIDQFEMDAVAGRGAIYLRLKPDARGVMTLRLEADDAGATLQAFDMYENVKGGKLVLQGAAANPTSKRIIYGNAELTDFHVVNAPVLAQLVSAISLLGIQQLLGGEGIYFSRLESEFIWQMNRKGDKYLIKDGRTSGSSLGLTFDGSIDKSIDRIDMEGTIVPVSFVNELISGIPLIGDILTGGGGGVIAATYEIQGPIKKPQVSVNPLSVLAPGILRQLLFEENE